MGPKKAPDADKKSAVSVGKSSEASAVHTEVKQDTPLTVTAMTRSPWFTKVDFSKQPGASEMLEKPRSQETNKQVKEAEEVEDPVTRFADTKTDIKQNSEVNPSESDAVKEHFQRPVEMDDDEADEEINNPESEVPEAANPGVQTEIDYQEKEAHVETPEEEFDNGEIEKPESEFETLGTKDSNEHIHKAGGPMEVEDEFLMQETVTLEEESDSQPESEDNNSEDEDEVGAGRQELKVLKTKSTEATVENGNKPVETEPTKIAGDQPQTLLDNNPQRRTYSCRYCPARFSGPREYKNHLVLHRDQFSLITQTPPVGHMVNLKMGNLKNQPLS